MNFHRDYKVEHPGVRIIENTSGFVTYRLEPKHNALSIMEIYVRPALRAQGHAQGLFNQVRKIAKEAEVETMTAVVDPTSPSISATKRSLELFGMEPQTSLLYLPMEWYLERIS